MNELKFHRNWNWNDF